MQSTDLMPKAIEQFKLEIAPFRLKNATAESMEMVSHITRIYTGRIQVLDLSLGQREACRILVNAFLSIKPESKS